MQQPTTAAQIQTLLNEIKTLNQQRQQLNNDIAVKIGEVKDIFKGVNPYHHSSVYIISSLNTPNVYIGSTTKTLEERLKIHVKDNKYYKKNNNRSCLTSFKLLDVGDYSISLLESVCCETEKELRVYEAKWIKLYNNIVNKRIEGRTRKEWHKLNYINNKTEINKWQTTKNTCQCGSNYTNVNKSRHLKSKHHQKYLKSIN